VFTAFLKKVEIGRDEDGEPVTTLVVDTVAFGEGETGRVTKGEKDLAVLKALQASPKASWDMLATITGVHKSSVERAINRLLKEKLIKKRALAEGLHNTKSRERSAP